jgi:NDP-4-keto-2,6-dideoxyhexose 3-C-methyltransferase
MGNNKTQTRNRIPHNKKEMITITTCRSCGSDELREVLDLGDQYLSDFREDNAIPPKYPLLAVLCEECYLVQLKHSVPQPEMYHENYGFKSGVSDSIKKDLDSVVTEAFQWVNNPKTWLDIACNDGTLLSFVPKDVYRVGVDPVKFLCEEAQKHAEVIINDYFTHWDALMHEPYDVITSISCFYDMPDPNQFVADVKAVLAKKGIWIIQQNYLLTTLELGAIDNFCHEHLEYYTLLSLEHLLNKHGLEVVDVSTSMVNGGSIRTVVAHKGAFEPTVAVQYQRDIEKQANLDTIKPYGDFAVRAIQNLDSLKQLINELNAKGNKIYILAASTRGATIWQAAGISAGDVVKAVERNPAKVGKWFSAIGIPIISEKQARDEKPDAMIIGPWFFADEIIEREKEYLNNGGMLIVPLPELEIIRG